MFDQRNSLQSEFRIAEIGNDEKLILYYAKFILLLVLLSLALIMYFLFFVYFVGHRDLLQSRRNHALIILLVVNFVQATSNVPLVIHFYHLGRISPATHVHCIWWSFWEFSLTGIHEFLMATISIQRHMLIFHSHLMHRRQFRILLHHFPIILSIVYPMIFYFSVVILYPCDGTQWDFSSNICGLAACYLVYNKVLAAYDWMINVGSPIVVILLANAALVIRVIQQKYRHQRLVSWRKQRRMTLQLLSVSCLYLVTWSPNVVIAFIQQVFLPDFLNEIQIDYIYDLTYFVCLLTPWLYIGLYPDFIKWLYDMYHHPFFRARVSPH